MRNPRVWFGGIIAILVMLGMYSGMSGSRVFLGEDGIVEWASAGLFAYAACLAAFVARPPQTRPDRTLRYYVIALAGMCCLSELSFGARIFGMDMPDMTGGGEIDGAQDLVLVSFRTLGASIVLIAASACLAAAAAWAIARRFQYRAALQWITEDSSRFIVALATLALLVALGCDLLEEPRLRSAEELIELSAAALLVLSQFPIVRRPGLYFASGE